MYLTNTTFAALTIRDGSPPFSKQFGGAGGDDADFFSVDVIGLNGAVETARITFFLADYRFDDASLDFFVDEWTQVDLSPLGLVTALEFELGSSDVGDFGINTPAYFALDELRFTPVPILASIWLMMSTVSIATWLGLGRRR